MKAIELLLNERNQHLEIFEQNKELGNPNEDIYIIILNESIKEIEDLQNENKSLVKTLEKYDKEMIELRKSNQDLLNTIIEAQKVIKNVLECKK